MSSPRSPNLNALRCRLLLPRRSEVSQEVGQSLRWLVLGHLTRWPGLGLFCLSSCAQACLGLRGLRWSCYLLPVAFPGRPVSGDSSRSLEGALCSAEDGLAGALNVAPLLERLFLPHRPVPPGS